MAIEFIQQKYDSKSKKVVESKIRPRQKIIELGGSLITNTKNISKSTVDTIKKTINRGK
jgi:hypothetical protein